MKKHYAKKRLPRLVFVEGFWNVGKTTLVKRLRNKNGYIFIEEPDHLTDHIQGRISQWYEIKHTQRLEHGIQKIVRGNRVVLERSALSSIAYRYATKGVLSDHTIKKIRKIAEIDELFICFLYGSKSFTMKQSVEIKDASVKKYTCQNAFYKRYLDFYKIILPEYFGNRIQFIKIDQNNHFISPEAVYRLFFQKLPLLKKEYVVCASVIPVYQNKILLLFDQNYHHYVFPQGHKKGDENITMTAKREMREETGFYHFEVKKKLKRYQYTFVANNCIIHKTIHVYLVHLLSLSSKRKCLEPHERYKNIFCSLDEAIAKAQWRQDKEILKEIKKSS